MKKFIALLTLAVCLTASSAFAYDQSRVDRVSQLMTSSAFGFSTAAFYPSNWTTPSWLSSSYYSNLLDDIMNF